MSCAVQVDLSIFQRFGAEDWQAVGAMLSLSRPYAKYELIPPPPPCAYHSPPLPSRACGRTDVESDAMAVLESSLDGTHGESATAGLDVARAYSTLWLAAVARGCVALMLSRALSVPLLSSSGAKQMHADIGAPLPPPPPFSCFSPRPSVQITSPMWSAPWDCHRIPSSFA